MNRLPLILRRTLLLRVTAWMALMCSAPAEEERKTIVFLLPASVHREAMAICLRQFTAELPRLCNRPVTVLTEDVAPGLTGYQKELDTWMHAKYQGRRVDLLVAYETPGSILGVQFRRELWPESPLLVSGINALRYRRFAGEGNVTGVTLDRDLTGFLESIHRLMPRAQKLAFVSGAYFPQPEQREAWIAGARDFASASGMAFLNLTARPKPEVFETVRALDRDTLLLFRNVIAGGTLPHSPSAELAGIAPVPVFALDDALAGEGVTAAVTVDYASLGNELAAQAAAVLRAGSASEVPPAASRAFVTWWDWRQLQRWGLDEKLLPAGADVRFRRPGLWEEHRHTMIVVSAAILVQGLLIARLLVQRRRRRRAEELLHQQRDQLSHALRVATVNQMATALAHELNQPLTAMVNNAGAARRLLEEEPVNTRECREILMDIETDGEHAGQLMRSTRQMLQPEAGEFQQADMTQLIAAARSLTAPECASRGCTVSVETMPGLPPVEVRPVQIQQVLVNLLLNAMDASAVPGAGASRIVVSAVPAAGRIEVSVRDFGPGLPPGDSARWFEPFQTTKPGGMGMGLAIARTIVEAHGGDIRAENAPGGGACFTFSLPVNESPLS